jgi:uncharacterized membrane protein
MPQGLIIPIAILTAVLAALAIGSLFAFSTFVMGALARLKPAEAISAMQSINIVVINPYFMSAFFGAALAFIVLSLAVVGDLGRPHAVLTLVAAALYIVGTIGITMVFNVPLNNGLAGADPVSAHADTIWSAYQGSWLMWNHIRTAAGALSLVLLILAIAEMRAAAAS